MKAIKTFGEQLSELMSQRSLSASALAAELGLSNVTGISRLLRNQASDKKQRELIQQLEEHGDLFDAAELGKLERSIDVNRLGKRAYKTQKSIEELIFQSQRAVSPPMMEETGGTLESYLLKLPPKEPLQILCFNCIENGVLTALEALLRDRQRVVEIKHYVSINEDTRNPALYINAASNLLFDSRYRPYTVTGNLNGSDAYFFAPCILLLKVGLGQSGEETLLAVNNERVVRAVRFSHATNGFEFITRLIDDLRPQPSPLKTPFGTENGKNMFDLIFSAYQMEKRRAYYHIKPDLSVRIVPPEMLTRVICDSPNIREDVKRMFSDRLLPIFRARHQNTLEKPQPTYFICSYAETKAFATSGVLTDQPLSMRPFTVEERRVIFDTVISVARNNPHYHFYFLWDDLSIRLFQFVGYEGMGVLVSKRDTHYDFEHGGDMLFVSEPMFLEQYINYYLETLIPRGAYSEAESLQMLINIRDEL